MKMLTVFLIGSIVFLGSLPVGAVDGPELTSYVYIMNADGSDQRPLFPYPIDARALDVSPDGTRVAYSTSGRRGFEIWVCDIDGSNSVNLTETDGISELGPSWSPDGTQFSFTIFSNGRGNVYIMDADGENTLGLTNHPSFNGGAAWSPDGSRLAFTSDRDGTRQIYLMNTDGSDLQNVTNNFVENVHYVQPDWSPDGNRIAYVAIVVHERHIYLRNVTGDPPQALVTNTTTAEHPSWSPDGSLIAFTSNLEGKNDIFVMNPGGQEVVNLTHGVGRNEYPTWTPDGRIIYASRRTLEEVGPIDRQIVGSDTVLTFLEGGGLSILRRSGNMPPVRLQRKNAGGGLEYVPLNRVEAEKILRQRGDTRVKLDKLFEP